MEDLNKKFQVSEQQLEVTKMDLDIERKRVHILEQELDEEHSRDQAGTEIDLLNWMPSLDDGSSVCDDDLRAGMVVQLNGLESKPELNGRWGTLVKYDLEQECWQVDLGLALGIKLLKSSKLLARLEDRGLPSYSDSTERSTI